jgi:hypothetical protein
MALLIDSMGSAFSLRLAVDGESRKSIDKRRAVRIEDSEDRAGVEPACVWAATFRTPFAV